MGSDIDLLVIYAGPERPEAYALVKRTFDLPRLEPHLHTYAEYEQSREMLDKMIRGQRYEKETSRDRESTRVRTCDSRASLSTFRA